MVKYYREKDRKLALASQLLQRAVASWTFGLSFMELPLKRTSHGRPYCPIASSSSFPSWDYNVSHHGEWVVIGTEPVAAIGVDVVDLEERPLEVMTAEKYIQFFRRQLTDREWVALMTVEGDAERFEAFYRIWAVKEAFVKAIGTGLGLNLNRVECVIRPNWTIVVDGIPRPEWKFRFSNLTSRYLVCIATGPSRIQVKGSITSKDIVVAWHDFLSFHRFRLSAHGVSILPLINVCFHRWMTSLREPQQV